MMISQFHYRRTREVTGPTPHSVGIIARQPSNKPPDHLIMQQRKKAAVVAETEADAKATKLKDLKNDWVTHTDKILKHNKVKQRVENLLQAKAITVEDRRDRLRRLLAEDAEKYAEEITGGEETLLERQAKMRARAKSLKEKRETERQEFVQQKLDQQWREQCEELRCTQSKQQHDKVCAARMDQLRVKDQEKLRLEEEERMYSDLWYADIAAKALREEVDTKRQMVGNLETLAVLQKQMAALAAQKEEEKKLIAEEAALVEEQQALRKLEEHQFLEDKRRKQEETRQMYTDSLEIKREKAAKELQQQLAFDMQILEKLLEDSRNEAMHKSQRKKERCEEDMRYRAYLDQLKIEEAALNIELERLGELEVEKTWQKRIKQWKLEKAARKQLLEDVMAGRRVQLQDKLLDNERAQAEAAIERAELLEKIEENKRLEKETARKTLEDAHMYQNDLLGQMDYNRRTMMKEQVEEERLWQAQNAAEVEYSTKLETALRNPVDYQMHPMQRRAFTNANPTMGRRK